MDTLTALKQKLEADGAKILLKLDQVKKDNKVLFNSTKTLQYVSKKVKEEQKLEKVWARKN